ncbi:MAG: WYL domain-containing protein [Treponema sp.]|nr:WYL domain-containing protein [Treponema sp.]
MEQEKKPARLNITKAALPRIYRIDEEIASGKYPNTRTLKEMFQGDWGKVSISTIIRDIDFLRDTFRAPIKYSALHRGYYYTEKTYRIPAGFTGAENMLALGMAKSILSLYHETPLYNASISLLESITAPLAASGNRDWLENRIVVPKTAAAKVQNEIWEAIIAGLKENRVITFDYRGRWDEDHKSRRVRPYQLLFDSGAWFLYGFSEERKSVRVFSLSRMKNALLTKDRFSLPPNYSYTNLTGGSYFGVFIGMEEYHFAIDCFGEAELYATERQWAEDQKIRKIKRKNTSGNGAPETGVSGNGVCLEFKSTQYDKVLEWVLSRGQYAIPRKPKRLVDDWIREIKEMAQNVSRETK